jgi:AbrB family looped-hinge helix DNA binding protein
MTFTATITSQGQITIPAKIRKWIGLKKRQRVILTLKNNYVVLQPEPDIMELSGSLNNYAIKNKSIDEIIKIEEKAIEDAIVERYKKKTK